LVCGYGSLNHGFVSLEFVRNVSNVAASTFVYYFKYIVTHPIVVLFVLPLVLLYFVADHLGSYEEQVTTFENAIAFVVWWLGLGTSDDSNCCALHK
jgi:hypothetical protein